MIQKRAALPAGVDVVDVEAIPVIEKLEQKPKPVKKSKKPAPKIKTGRTKASGSKNPPPLEVHPVPALPGLNVIKLFLVRNSGIFVIS